MNPSFVGRRHNTAWFGKHVDGLFTEAQNEKAGWWFFRTRRTTTSVQIERVKQQEIQLYKSTDRADLNAGLELLASTVLSPGQANAPIRFKIEARGAHMPSSTDLATNGEDTERGC